VYATLPLRRLVAVLGWPAAIILAVLIIMCGVPGSPTEWGRTIGSAITLWGFLLLIVMGSSSRWSPWRVFWWLIPGLNRWIFPDLNGAWHGKTCSNWTVVKRVRDAAINSGGIKAEDLEDVPLQEDNLTINVKASLFSLRVTAELSSTGATSHSLTARVAKNETRDEFELFYIYCQETPEARLTDESTHLGAAILNINLDDWILSGQYWNKRRWRVGNNTAGLIRLRRMSRFV